METLSRVSTSHFFYFRRKRNSDETLSQFLEISMFRFSEISIWMTKSDLRFRFDFDLLLSILISISESELLSWASKLRFRHRNSDFSTRFRYQWRNFKAFFAKISFNFYFNCLSEYRFRLSKSKCRLLSTFSTNNSSKVEINFDWNSDQNSDEINFGGNPMYCTVRVQKAGFITMLYRYL
jgi:hypothetical protein